MGCLSDLVWEMDAPGNGLLTLYKILYFLYIANLLLMHKAKIMEIHKRDSFNFFITEKINK